MRQIVIYIIETIVCSGLFIVLYKGIILPKASYRFCRSFLVITSLLSVTIPILNVPLFPKDAIYMQIPIVPQKYASGVITSEISKAQTVEKKESKSENSSKAISAPKLSQEEYWIYASIFIYLIVMLVSISIIVRWLISLIILRKNGTKTYFSGYQIVESEKITSPFTFMKTIFLGYGYVDYERSQIFSHELSHVRHRHSIERMIMSIIRSLFWFNPFIWFVEKRLEEVQEWQADKDALLEGYEIGQYRLTIIKQLFGYNPEITAGLNNSFTKNRFIIMKQPEFSGNSFFQIFATLMLSSLLFLCFGCKTSDKDFSSKNKVTNSIVPESDRIILTADRFFDDIEGVEKRSTHYVMSRDSRSLVRRGIEIQENFLNKEHPVTIAVNGSYIADSPNSKELKWVNNSTVIIIDGKKSSLSDFKALEEGKYLNIYYFKPAKSKKEFGLVFVNTTMYGPVADYNYMTVVDNPSLDLPDIVSCGGLGVYKVFIYQTGKYNVAAPDALFAIDGKLIDYEDFREYYYTNGIPDILIYRNGEAKKRFGGDAWEVVEVRSSVGVTIKFGNKPTGDIYPIINQKECTLEEIPSKIKEIKEFNKSNGRNTHVNLVLHRNVSDELSENLLNNIVDLDDPEIIYTVERYKEKKISNAIYSEISYPLSSK